MKVLHILLDQNKFSESMIPFLQREFSDYNFHYCVFSKLSTESFSTKRMEGVDYYYRKNIFHEISLIKDLLKKYDVVFFHSMCVSPVARIFLSFNKNLIRRIVWIPWGYDLYFEMLDNSIRERIKLFLKKLSIKLFNRYIPFFVAIHEVDKLQYDRVVSGHAVKYQVMYATCNKKLPVGYKMKTMTEKIKNGDPITIQVGHRAEPYLKHIETLQQLERFKNENIRLVLPLSYGDMNYGKMVSDFATKAFGEKAKILSDFVPPKTYMDILQSVDVFILNSKRQIALGNIHKLLSLGKKIYLPQDSILFEYYTNNNIPVYNIESLYNCSFHELTKDTDAKRLREYIQKLYDTDIIEMWRDVFVGILGE